MRHGELRQTFGDRAYHCSAARKQNTLSIQLIIAYLEAPDCFVGGYSFGNLPPLIEYLFIILKNFGKLHCTQFCAQLVFQFLEYFFHAFFG